MGGVAKGASQMNTSVPVLLTLKQTCELLQLKPSRLYYLTSTKQIPFVKIGSTLRFDRDEITAWINDNRCGAR
jgi:excisionase family DNA binding protein